MIYNIFCGLPLFKTLFAAPCLFHAFLFCRLSGLPLFYLEPNCLTCRLTADFLIKSTKLP